MFKFAIIFNSNTSGDRELKLTNTIIKLLKRNHQVELFETETEQAAAKIFKKLSSRNFDRLIIVGGDGSMYFAVNEILKLSSLADKLIGYIPSGTTNILQIEMKIKKNTDEIYRVLVSDKAKRINLTKINDKYFFLMLGVGFDSKIVESINTNLKKYLGKIIFAIKGFQHFLFLRNEKMSIEIDGETINADWILCSNSKYYAGPHSITKETNIFDDKVIVYIFRDLTRVKLLYYVWLILTKGDLSSAKSIIKRRLNSLRIKGIKNKIIIQVDGENYGYSQSVEIKKTSKYINLLIP